MNQDYKLDQGKTQLGLLPPGPLREIARVLEYGASKYSPNKWREGCDYSRLYAAALRHLFAWYEGETDDPETGVSHLAHAACNMLFLMEFRKTGAGFDDRPLPGVTDDRLEERRATATDATTNP